MAVDLLLFFCNVLEVLADDIVTGKTDGYVKDWNINGEDVTLAVKKQ